MTPSTPIKHTMPNGEYAIAIPLRHGSTNELLDWTLVSPEDAGQADFSWRLLGAGYAVRWKEGTTAYLHREILGLSPGDKVEADHINRDKLDNRRENLRRCTRKENGQNLPSQAGTSRYRGVSWDKRWGKWEAGVKVNGKRHGLGHYTREADAAVAAAKFRAAHMPFSEEASNAEHS